MLLDRVVKAFTFRREVYAEVEHDTSFTKTAWMLVVVIGFLNNLGTNASSDFFGWMRNTVIQTIIGIIGFAVAAFVMSWVGKAFFKAEVTFDEMVRTLGLAYVWNVVGVIGAFSGFLACLLGPALFLGWIMTVLSWFVAAKEALDLDTGQTLLTVILGWVAFGLIWAFGSMMIGLMGWTVAGFGDILDL